MAEDALQSFTKNQQDGLKARRAGAWETARKYLLQAERNNADLIAAAQTNLLRDKRRKLGEQLRILIEDCETAKVENRPPPGAADAGASPAADAPHIEVARPASGGPVTYAMYERYRDQGMAAWHARQWGPAETYLLEAARAIRELASHVEFDEARKVRLETADRLEAKAAACRDQKQGNRRGAAQAQKSRPGGPSGGGGGGGGGPQGSEEAETDASQWIVQEKPNLRFDDVAGLESVKEDIRLKMIYPFEHPELAEKFGIRPGGGVLMYGPPGTGKTMLAKAVAGEIDATFFRISPADVLSKWVGEAEQNIKKLFDAAAGEKRSIIFVDEIEALVPARRDDGSSVMQRVVPQILQGVEGFDRKSGRSLLLMGATNVPWQLDTAMMRPGRFDEKIYIPLPDLPARRKLLDIYLSKRPIGPEVDLDAWAKRMEGYSGADIKYLCDRAATIPFLASVASGIEGSITPQILDDVLHDTPRSVTAEMLKKFDDWARQAVSG